jgi:hypothetical protein
MVFSASSFSVDFKTVADDSFLSFIQNCFEEHRINSSPTKTLIILNSITFFPGHGFQRYGQS